MLLLRGCSQPWAGGITAGHRCRNARQLECDVIVLLMSERLFPFSHFRLQERRTETTRSLAPLCPNKRIPNKKIYAFVYLLVFVKREQRLTWLLERGIIINLVGARIRIESYEFYEVCLVCKKSVWMIIFFQKDCL